jgi:hypothetical protein
VTSLDELPEYRNWLANFSVEYHSPAELLVNALHYLDDSTFRSNLTDQILGDFEAGRIVPPALVTPIRSGLEMGLQGSEKAIIFENVFPRDGLRIPNTGSEAICANIIRNLEKGQGQKLGMIPWPRGLDDLRRQEVRSIVLVGDYAGSGSQAMEAARIWTRNKSIRSWRSYGKIKIHVLVHSASSLAKEALDKDPSIDRLSTVGIAPDFDSAGWSDEQRNEIQTFCTKFARHRGKDVLGWKNSAALFVMQHTAPNNLPSVLWQTKGQSRRHDGWYPLFPDGRVPGALARALASQGKQRREQRIPKRPGSEQILGSLLPLVLAAMREGARTPERISGLADISLADSTRVLAELVDGGYADTRGYLTDSGRRLLAPDARPLRRYRLSGSADFYYPQALRRVGGI